MLHIDSKTFNPEILYAFDAYSSGPSIGKSHSHDFFEMSVMLDGQSYYDIEGHIHHVHKGAILLLNPGVKHQVSTPEGETNRQLHLGLRHFAIDRFPKNFFPLNTTVTYLSEYQDVFSQTCQEIMTERLERKKGHAVILKGLILKLMIYILRDKTSDSKEDTALILSEEDYNRQQLVTEVKLYMESHYSEDITLSDIAQAFYTSPATISRAFKDQLDDSPINYLIQYRLEKAKSLIENHPNISVTDTAQLVGYEDALYFSKLFKKYYGSSPTHYRDF